MMVVIKSEWNYVFVFTNYDDKTERVEKDLYVKQPLNSRQAQLTHPKKGHTSIFVLWFSRHFLCGGLKKYEANKKPVVLYRKA